MKGRIVVTGGAGFIGSNIVRALNESGREDILVVDHLGLSDKWKNLRGLRFADYLERDEFRRRVLEDRLGHIAGVVHMGACSATTERDASYLADNNYRFSIELCEWCVAHHARLVYASSAATYGDGAAGYADDPAHLSDLRPMNMYGFSKHLFDLWARRRNLLGLIAGLKFFNVYGPGEAHKGDMRSMVHKAWGQIQATGRVRLFKSARPDFGDGEQRRDFVYVRDAAAVVLHLLTHNEINGLFNCGQGKARTWNDLAAAVFAAMGRKPDIEYIDMPDALRDRYQYHTEADITRLRQAGYAAPMTSLEDGVADYVKNHLMPGLCD